jgi:hypothetical protein
MKLSRHIGAVLSALLAILAVALPSNAVAFPEFKPVPPRNRTIGASGPGIFTMNNRRVACLGDSVVETIAGPMRGSTITIRLKNCKRIKGAEECEAKSVGASKEEVVTLTLKGELGTVKTSEAASGVGFLLEPETGKRIVTIEKNFCGSEELITGSVAGEVLPIGSKQLTSKLNFALTSAEQKIKVIAVLAGLKEPLLVAGSEPAALETLEDLEFEEALEVT